MLHIIEAVDQTPYLVGGGFPELLNVKDGAWEGLLFSQAMDGQGIVQVWTELRNLTYGPRAITVRRSNFWSQSYFSTKYIPLVKMWPCEIKSELV